MIFAILLLWGGFVPAQDAVKPISLEDIWLNYRFFPAFPQEFNWMKDDNFYSVLEEGAIVKYSLKDRKAVGKILDLATVKDPKTGASVEAQSYEFNADESKVLLRTEIEGIYRHSDKAVCYVYDFATQKVVMLENGSKISYPTFNPTSDKIAYVFENNLFVFDLVKNARTQATADGKRNAIINGGTDWVYEEEFGFAQGFSWSSDGKKIGFYRFDESHVREFSMDMYGTLYPDLYKFKYPKAGEANAYVDIMVFNTETGKTVKADLGTEKDQYIPRIKWTADANQLAVMRMNRLQNHLDLLLVSADNGSSKVILTEDEATFIDEVDDMKWIFLKNGKEFLWQAETDGYNHVYRYDFTGKLLNAVTAGKWEVSDIAAVDEENQLLYFISPEVSPMERHLYSIQLDGKKKKQLTTESGWHEITFSGNNSFYLDTYSSIAKPAVSALYDKKGKQLQVIEDNAALAARMKEYETTTPEFIKVKTPEVELNGYMIKPYNFDPKKKYPVLMHVYGGPGHQTVTNQFQGFNYFWHQMLANQGYIIVSVDNRGTGGRGEEFRKSTYAQLGKLETIDQIESAKYLATLPYVDGNRIGIWGWSFGGYMTSLCLTKGADIFKAGIAVAPVTNWRYYDSIYTERYLKTPQLNPEGYDENSPINFAKQLKGKYLIVHGTADDNVHFQNSMEMVNALVKANRQFDMHFYPNRNHGIYGGVTRFHLYKKMTDFVLQNL